jgi:hypothetical protein
MPTTPPVFLTFRAVVCCGHPWFWSPRAVGIVSPVLHQEDDIKFEEKTEKRRISVVWDDRRVPFVWRVGTPPDLMTRRLCRTLDYRLSPRLLWLSLAPGGQPCELSDDIPSGTVVFASFRDAGGGGGAGGRTGSSSLALTLSPSLGQPPPTGCPSDLGFLGGGSGGGGGGGGDGGGGGGGGGGASYPSRPPGTGSKKKVRCFPLLL